VRLCNPFYLGRLWRDAGFARRVRAIVESGEFDLVQSHERIPGCHVYRAGDGVHATWLEQRARVQSPLARLFTALHPWQRYICAVEAAMFRHPALRAVICNSQMVRDDIARRFGVAAERLHVIHNGVDTGHFHPGLREQHREALRIELGIPRLAPLVLFVGSGFERKGLPQLIEAMAGLEGVHLLVVGKDRHEVRARTQAQRLGIAARVHFAGGQQDVRPYYGAADVFALPTLYDPFPNAALEALACGLPVLTSTGSGAAELLDGDCGRVTDALDIAAQRLALSELLALPRQAVVASARAAAESCAVEDMGAQLIALYTALLQG
jgi:UDP-glucose:(heptosyl)LPS alpha-1,3-glucosyltransferase